MTTATRPSLSDIIKERQTTLLNKYGVFFAFSNEQFEEQMDKNLELSDYCSIGMGGYMPTKNAEAYGKEYEQLIKDGIKELKEQFTKEQIVLYELSNYECWYTGDIEDALPILKDYGYTRDEVTEIYKANYEQYA